VKSRAGEGSTFGFSVPLKDDEQQSERPEKVEK